jgi:hypothetical protein
MVISSLLIQKGVSNRNLQERTYKRAAYFPMFSTLLVKLASTSSPSSRKEGICRFRSVKNRIELHTRLLENVAESKRGWIEQ